MTSRRATADRSPQAQFDGFVSRFPPEIIALVKRCLPRIRRAVPHTHEVVYDYSHSVVMSLGMSERGYQAIVSVAILPDMLRLYFDKDLPDPKGLLEGSGTKVRSVAIKTASDVDHADIQALFKAAIGHAGAKLPADSAHSTTMIIKSGSKAKRAKKKTSEKTKSKKP